MIRVVTIAREYGSGGREIARLVAARLGWELVDRRLIEEAARLAGVPPEEAEEYDERCDGWMMRVARTLWTGNPMFANVPPEGLDADTMATLSRRVVEEAANAGQCVIVGRGAQCILRGRADVLHVFVYAPREARLARLLPRCGTIPDAEQAMARIDRERAAYNGHYYGCDWSTRDLYDLLVNSGRGVEVAASLVVAAATAA